MKNPTVLTRLARPLLALALASTAANASEPPVISWQPFADDVFVRAAKENKLVLLDLEAVWCHWCHVMDETTYHDPDVVELVRSHIIAVRVDQDSRPDLSNRYEDYGWPATILFDPHGKEIAKRSGYIPPPAMASMLRAFVEDPRPGPSVGAETSPTLATVARLDESLRRKLQKSHDDGYDTRRGGWGFGHKFLDPDCVEWSMVRARAGDARSRSRARRTLKAETALLDPAWGGVYQYSTGGDWKEPHFEKIMQMQAGNLRVYSLAYAEERNPEDLAVARAIRRYLKTFLTSPEGAFYTSQDADLMPGKHAAEYFALSDADRRKQGVPPVDTHVYARENGWAIEALATLSAASGGESALEDAVRAATWIEKNRALTGGGFSHGGPNEPSVYLGDTLAMGRAFLALYEGTGGRAWLARAQSAADFVDRTFRAEGAGYVTSSARAAALPAGPQRDENTALVRFANRLFHVTGKPSHRAMAERAMRFVAAPEIARRPPAAAVLLAEWELTHDPLHVTIVGRKTDPSARALFRTAIACPPSYKRVEWFDPGEGPLPNADVAYPEMDRAAAFSCSGGRCSAPVFEAQKLRLRIERLIGAQAEAALAGK